METLIVVVIEIRSSWMFERIARYPHIALSVQSALMEILVRHVGRYLQAKTSHHISTL